MASMAWGFSVDVGSCNGYARGRHPCGQWHSNQRCGRGGAHRWRVRNWVLDGSRVRWCPDRALHQLLQYVVDDSMMGCAQDAFCAHRWLQVARGVFGIHINGIGGIQGGRTRCSQWDVGNDWGGRYHRNMVCMLIQDSSVTWGSWGHWWWREREHFRNGDRSMGLQVSVTMTVQVSLGKLCGCGCGWVKGRGWYVGCCC